MITSKKSLLDRVSGLLLLPAIAAITLASAPVNATSANATSASAASTTALTKQAQKALKLEKKAAKKAAKAAAKKAKLCAKKSNKPKKARKLLAKQQRAGCFASTGTGAQNGTGTEVAANAGSGNSSQATGIDPATLPLLFTPTSGNGDITGNGGNGTGGGTGEGGSTGGNGASGNDGSANLVDLVDAAPTAVPEPGTLGLLGLGLVSIGVLRRRKR